MGTNRDSDICGMPGCEAPRKRYPSGRAGALCARHEAARVRDAKSRPAVDPVTGETITAGLVALRQFRRRRQAAAAEGAS